MIKREIYLNKLRGYKDKDMIKVITGIRRCGKSTLPEMFRDELMETGIESNRIIAVNFEDMNNSYLLNAKVLRRGYDIYIGKVGQLQVDFVARTNEETIYIQVAASARSEEVYNREIRSLKAINDSYPKYILTLDNDPKMNDEGIWIMNAI